MWARPLSEFVVTRDQREKVMRFFWKSTLVILLLFSVQMPSAVAERATIGGPTGPDGTEVACDLPALEHIKNVGGRDGAGLCVFTSIEHSGRWQNCEGLRGFQAKMRSELGGGYPEKVDHMMRKYIPEAKYIQYSGNDPAVLDLAIKTGRMPAVTYGYSERYGGRVAHMVNLVHIDEKVACILDNNFIGADRLEWMSRGEFLRRWKLDGGGWAVVVLNPPPPPVPANMTPMTELAKNRSGAIAELAGPNGRLVYGSWGPSGCGSVEPVDFETARQRFSLQKSTAETQMQRIFNRGRDVRLPSEESQYAEQEKFSSPVAASLLGAGCDWKLRRDDPNRLYLYRNGVQIGGWDESEKRWMDYNDGSQKWTDGCPPWYASQRTENRNPKVGQVFFGVDRRQVPQTETFSVNGQRVEFRNIKEAFVSDTLSDDSGKLRITLCGTKEACDSILSDMKSDPAMASMSSKFLIQAYRPGTWPVEVFKRPVGEGCFLSISGPPDKRGRGIEYHSQMAYEGPEKLAQSMDGALRRADPNYDPNKTPDLTKPKPPPVLPGPMPEPDSGSGPSLWLLVAFLMALLFGGKRNANSK